MNDLINLQLDLINKINPKYEKKLLLTQEEVADIIGISTGTLKNIRSKGFGPRYIKFKYGNKERVLYPKTALAQWVNETEKINDEWIIDEKN
ncbi:helix-turn-helix transcriptional regulator [Halarcobacter ebronensis]|uniref:Helix-turn-helix domain-containing protein n=1 Tax=Halarcobacter ebronensis TaxID=1462615 RepID=A0A4Q1APG0_9BACT|nr:helix-turn-helix domain-containing protein [Halarcobacter ebronensis]QKF80725.1 DNA-binding protein (HTH domain) [Halarcobacter ebronensis]RXK08518.1 hypothetical protein CRV07_01590 [Halarcobacter ebronensis]